MCGATISKSFTVAPTNAANHTALPSFMVVNAYIYICYINNCMEIHAVWGDVGLFDTGFLSPNGLRYIVPAGGWQHMVPKPQKGT